MISAQITEEVAASESLQLPDGLTLPMPPAELFDRAFLGTSHTPRGEETQREYLDNVAELANAAGDHLTQDDLDDYATAFAAWLDAHGSCLSTFIAGPSNFNTRRAQKANKAEDKRRAELGAKFQRIVRRARRAQKAAEIDAAGGSEAILIQEIDEAESAQERMKTANRIVRSKPRNQQTPEKLQRLRALSFTQDQARALLMPSEWDHGYGFPAYALANNRQTITRKKERLAELEARAKAANKEDDVRSFDGVTVTLAHGDNRIRITHEAMPTANIRGALKGAAWRWCRHQGAWQRQLTQDAISSAERILDVRIAVEETDEETHAAALED